MLLGPSSVATREFLLRRRVLCGKISPLSCIVNIFAYSAATPQWKYRVTAVRERIQWLLVQTSSGIPLLNSVYTLTSKHKHHNRQYAPQTQHITSHHGINNRLFRVIFLEMKSKVKKNVPSYNYYTWHVLAAMPTDPTHCIIFVPKNNRSIHTHTPHSLNLQ